MCTTSIIYTMKDVVTMLKQRSKKLANNESTVIISTCIMQKILNCVNQVTWFAPNFVVIYSHINAIISGYWPISCIYSFKIYPV